MVETIFHGVSLCDQMMAMGQVLAVLVFQGQAILKSWQRAKRIGFPSGQGWAQYVQIDTG